jgi:predicted nuclease of predicted toxin-antitoxin system
MRKFLIDENVNQKAVRTIPAQQKGFDILYPEAGGLKGARDPFVHNRAVQEDRILVTCDRDFAPLGAPRDLLRSGVLWIRPSPRISQRRVSELLRKFCEFLQRTFASDPYDFAGKMFVIHERGVQITTRENEVTNYDF